MTGKPRVPLASSKELDSPVVFFRDCGATLPKDPEIRKSAQFCHEIDPEPINFRSLAPVMHRVSTRGSGGIKSGDVNAHGAEFGQGGMQGEEIRFVGQDEEINVRLNRAAP